MIRQLLVEALVIGGAGALLGLVFNFFLVRWFLAAVADMQAPYWLEWSVDLPVLFFTVTVTLLAALLAGTVPALRASGVSPGTVLNDESRGSSGLHMGRFGTGLVVVELAVSCALMIASGLVVRSVNALNQLDTGFETELITTGRLALFETDYPDPDERNRFFHDVLERIASDPATDMAALTSVLPRTGQAGWRVHIEGDAYPLPEDVPEAGGVLVSPGFFDTFGIRLMEGRDFLLSESMTGGEPVAIVTEGFVRRHLGGRSALGSRIRVGVFPDPAEPWARIVGVVPDTYQGMGRFGSAEQMQEVIYLPLAAARLNAIMLAVRARGVQPVETTRLRQAVAEIDPTLPLHLVMPMEAAVAEADFIRRIFGTLSSFFSVVALFLASVGLYGVIDFSVSSRLHETGIRVALGARRSTIVGLVLGRVSRQLGLGLLIGVIAGFLLANPMSAALVGIPTWDPLVYGLVVLTLTSTALLAAAVPTLKAISVDPADALRAD